MKTFASALRVDSIRHKLERAEISQLMVGISIVLYVFACFLPTIQYDAFSWAKPTWTPHEAPGYESLLLGWFMIFLGQYGWCANPLLLIAWIAVLQQRWETAILCASMAFLAGLHTFTLTALPGFFKEEDDRVTGFAVGVYVWLGSMLVVAIGVALIRYGGLAASSKPITWAREKPAWFLIPSAIALLAIGTLAAVIISKTAAPSADSTPPGGKIVFLVNETEPYVINADGTGLQTYHEQDMVSPDGKHVARVEGPVWEGTLCVMNSEGDGKNCFENTGIPQWSPDGKRLVFTQFDETTHTTSIGIMNADGTGEMLLRKGMYARWSPNGQLIFYSGDCSAEHPAGGVCAINTDGTNVKWIAAGDSGSIDWSPDNRRMVLSGDYSNIIYIANADGTGAREITAGNAPRWSPDGTKIVFEHRTGNTHETDSIYIMNADGTDITCLTKGHRDGNPVWSPDGKHIAFESYRDGDDYHIFIMHPDGSNVHRLTSLPERELYPDWLAE